MLRNSLIVFMVGLVLANAIDPPPQPVETKENSLEVVWAFMIVVQFVILGYYVNNVIGVTQKMPEQNVEVFEDMDSLLSNNKRYKF